MTMQAGTPLLLAAQHDPARPWTWAFVGVTFALYLYIGWRNRVRETAGFYVAGQGVPAIANGAATAADWMSAASFISMAGLISFSGSDGAVYLMGWTGGYVLLALLLAPYLRKFGHYTVPDFLGIRYYSNTARVVGAVCAIFISLTYVAGQMKGVGVVFSRFLEVDLTVGVAIGMAIVGFFAVLGGMKGITWTQVAQYFVLVVAFLIPSIAISAKLTGSLVPQHAFAFSDISQRLNDVLLELGEQEYTRPFVKFSRLNVFCITASLMFGTAGLPHVIVRFYTVKSVRAARYSAAWAIFFIAILYTTAPALGLFARYNLIHSLHESKIEAVVLQPKRGEPCTLSFASNHTEAVQAIRAAEQQNAEAAIDPNVAPVSIVYHLKSRSGESLDWATRWQSTGLLVVEDLDNDGSINLKLIDHESQGTTVRRSELARIDKDIIVLSTPEVAGLPPWVIALVAAGGLAAALSTAAGLLLVISSALAHDLYVQFLAPNATEEQRVRIGRIAIILAILLAGYFGIHPPGFVGEVVAFAFGLAAASFFPAIFLGIFVKRVNSAGAICGMIVGLVFTMVYIIMCTSDKVLPLLYDAPLLTPDQWLLGISPQGIGTFGMLLNFAVTLVVSWITPAPPLEVMELVEKIRIPRGSADAAGH